MFVYGQHVIYQSLSSSRCHSDLLTSPSLIWWNLKMPHNRVKSDRFYSKQFCNRMLTEILPTLRKISREISKCRTAEDLKEFIPGKNARTVLVDGTHIPVRRSGDAERRNSTYSGKKKTHTYNTTVTSAKNNIISGIGRIVVGKTHDITLFREDPLPFGRWYERMCDEDTPKDERFTVYMDLGYHGIKKIFMGPT